jgi:glycosyltransferase involved in cell wall biosynthesis
MNGLLPGKAAHEVELRGSVNIGVIFLEDTTIDGQSRERAELFSLLVAGSTWNKRLLEDKGITTPVELVLQGVDPTLFHPAPKSGLFRDRFVVFSGGKLEYRKGQDLVLLAFRAFLARHPEALLVTAWHSPWAGFALSLAANTRIAPVPINNGRVDPAAWASANGIPAENFLDLGAVPNSQMPQILRECDVALFANRAEGGTNLVAMECMACGVPCVISANTGHLDLIRSDSCVPLTRQIPVIPVPGSGGTEGWGESDVEEAVEALEAIWQGRQRAQCIGRGGAMLMAKLSWPKQIAELKRVLLPYLL